MSGGDNYLGLNIYYGDRQRMDFYVDDDYCLPLNAQFSTTNPNDLLYIQTPLNDTNYFLDRYYLSTGNVGKYTHTYTHSSCRSSKGYFKL